MGTLENRAHESWLAARQSERRCEEALAEAAGLRRKLTTMASGGGVAGDPGVMEAIVANGAPVLGAELKTAPSPLPLPGSPLLNMPNPLPFLAAPFSPFMGLPPPFLPPTGAGGARPPPLGRMRSPPPSSRGDRDRDRYSDYSDYEEAEQQLRVQEDDLQHLDDSVDTQSNEVFDNPNDYYKDQQTEQHHHHQHHHNPTESAYNNPSSAEQTTPTPDTESPYGAVHEESTQASPTDFERAGVGSVEPVALPATSSPASEVPVKEDGVGVGLFATIVDTVNNFIGKEPQAGPSDNSDELQRILYPGIAEVASSQKKPEGELVIMSTLFPMSK